MGDSEPQRRTLNTSDLEQWLADTELEMAGRLDQVNLIVRADFEESEVHRLQGFYGIASKRSRLRRRPVREFVAQYPALTLTVLAGHAALAYEQGRYWESFWEELGVPKTLAFESALRECVEPNLERFGLDVFPELRGRYVQTLGVHSGIPIHCMDALVAVAAMYLHRGMDASGAGLADWITRSERNADVLALASPVRNFLRFGGVFAIEVLDRIVRGLSDSDSDRPLDALDDHGITLPAITLEGIRAALSAFRAPAVPGTQPAVVRRQANPTLAYSFLDDQIVVDLPATPADDEVWSVSVDGETNLVEPESRWGIEWYEAPPTSVPVKRPAREVIVEQGSSGRIRSLPVVRADDPVLLFDMEGKPLNDRASLPKSEVIVVQPVDATLVDRVSGSAIEPYAELVTPSGWAGWRAMMVDLAGSDSFQIETGSTHGILRGVRVVEAPEIVLSDRLIGLTTSSGIQVVGSRPRLRLPARASSETSKWLVRVRAANGTVLAESEFAARSERQEVDPFANITPPLVGPLTVSVTGSAGSSVEFTTFVLEGVQVSLSRWVRVPASGGLSEVTARFDSTLGIDAIEPRMTFAAGDIRRAATFTNDGHSHTLYLTPPHIQIHVGVPDQAIKWFTSSRVLLHDDLETSLLVLSIPGCTSVRLEVRDRDGNRLKWYCPKRRVDDQFAVDLRVFYDVVHGLDQCELTALAVSEDERIARFAVATIRPVGTCEGIWVEDGHMVFDGLRIVDDLAASVWWTTAPWAGGIEMAVTENRMPLPKELKRAGDLLVKLHVADPWVRYDPPIWPDNSAFVVEQPGYKKDRNNGRERLSKYLAEGGTAPTSEKTMPEIWSVLARVLDDVGDVHSSQTRRELLRVVSENPRKALETLGNSTVPASGIPALIVETEIVRQSFWANDTRNELHVNPWVGCMVEIADLPSLFVRRHDVVEERSETLRYLAKHGGTELLTVLLSGQLPATGRQRHEIISDIVRLGDEALERFAVLARSVPSALLSPESIWSAYLEAFDAREAWLGIDSPSGLLADARHLAKDLAGTWSHLDAAVNERLDIVAAVFDEGNQWTAIPAFTFVVAALARLEAHGLVSDALSPGMVETWGRLAARCPNLVTTDLLLAEAVVTRHQHGDLLSESIVDETVRRLRRRNLVGSDASAGDAEFPQQRLENR
ncbi:hypothetical protein MWU77_23465 [Rhodococcus sp. F64268]|uniref:hypothetical protein n=1 Tax=Rhodococcus sp. F64268 TaxID=2926402 RepID=UPI001FF3313D|nr:hypothetical protein [Rhodococcus sp. F64268]MCK0093733.1 hypothetical protein [Rhodococcus sp. F64268]